MNEYDHHDRALREQVHQLAQAAVLGELGTDAANELESLLVSSEQAREIYTSFILDTVVLRLLAAGTEEGSSSSELQPLGPSAVGGAPLVVPPISTPLDDASTALEFSEFCGSTSNLPGMSFVGRLFSFGSSSISVPTFFSLLIVMLVFGAGLAVGLLRDKRLPHQEAPPLVASSSKEITPVAYLTSVNGCQWGHQSDRIWHVGRNVNVGDELALHEGIAEFHLASGVAISIEGPAAVVVHSPTSLVLQYGKISAHVPWTVTDFKVLASACRITAYEAEFGVNLTGTEVDIHAFSGEVIVGSTPFEILKMDQGVEELDHSRIRRREEDLPSGSEFIEAAIPKGRALRLTGSHNGMKILRWHRTREHEFTTKLSMAGPLNVSPEYASAVLNSKPLAYWRFETVTNNRIPSEVLPANDLCIVGKTRLVADGDSRFVEFGLPGCEGHLVSSEPLNALAASDYSVETWFKPSHVHRGVLLGLAVNQHLESNQVGPTNFHAFFLETVGALVPASLQELGLKKPSVVRFLHRDPPGTQFRTGTSCFSAKAYAPRRWQQVVAVKEGSTMRLYLNGNLTGSVEDPTTLARGLYLEIGQLIGGHDKLPFIGQLDELSVYNRALSEREIKQHYKAMNSGERKVQPKRGTEA